VWKSAVSPDTELRDAPQVSPAKILGIDVIVDGDRFLPHITPKLLDHLLRHVVPSEVGSEPVPEAVRSEVVLELV